MEKNFKVTHSNGSMSIALSFVLIVMIINIAAYFKTGNHENLLHLIFFILVLFGIIYIFKSFSVEVVEEILVYKSPFSKTIEIPLQAIEKAWIKTGYKGMKRTSGPFIRLVIRPKKDTQMDEFYINFKVLKLEGVQKLISVLPMKGDKGLSIVSRVKKIG